MPTNPVHHCAKDDTDWSYVYFGSYPQTEVTGTALTSAITNVDYDTNGDAWVNGMKYRRISKSDTNYDSHFGNSTYRYFKWERIKWRVLENNGNTLFVVADQGLDCKDYNEEKTSITWEHCTLRTWLNETFYNTAFSNSEQGAIMQQTVVNDNNPWNGTLGGNNTQDNVYLLSIAEVTNPKYGFCEDDDGNSPSRWMQPSDYAAVMGCGKGGPNDYAENCYWWLRSPGKDTDQAANVFDDGTDSHNTWDGNCYDVDMFSFATVPALHINLSSELWTTIDGITSNEAIGNPEHHCSKDDCTDWSYVYFGSYPQTEVADDALTMEIIGANYDTNGDAWVDGMKYRRASSDANSTAYFGDSNYRYFK